LVDLLDETGVASFFAKPQVPLTEGSQYCVIADKSLHRYIELKDMVPGSKHPVVQYLKIQAPMCDEGTFFIVAVNSRVTKKGSKMGTIIFADAHKKLYSCTVWPSDYIQVASRVKEGTFVKLMTEVKDDGLRVYAGIR